MRSRRVASWIGAVGVLWVSGAGSLASQQPVLGYTDTPMQPDGRWRVHDLNRPRPRAVAPGALASAPPPADAVILLGPGADLSSWQMDNGTPVSWPMVDGAVQTGRGMVRTRAEFGSIQLHVEFATPATVQGASQGRGNSGVFLAGAFEIQVLDSYENPTYADGQAASMYGQFPPLVNASRPPGEWQSYDIVFMAPRFSASGALVDSARVTVHHNGILVHHARAFWGATRHRANGEYAPSMARGPLRLQDHGNPVRFRNIWVRELAAPE